MRHKKRCERRACEHGSGTCDDDINTCNVGETTNAAMQKQHVHNRKASSRSAWEVLSLSDIEEEEAAVEERKATQQTPKSVQTGIQGHVTTVGKVVIQAGASERTLRTRVLWKGGKERAGSWWLRDKKQQRCHSKIAHISDLHLRTCSASSNDSLSFSQHTGRGIGVQAYMLTAYPQPPCLEPDV